MPLHASIAPFTLADGAYGTEVSDVWREDESRSKLFGLTLIKISVGLVITGVATSFTSATPTAVPTSARDVEGAMIKMRWRGLSKEVDSPNFSEIS
jgi:hypothetical protein